MGDRGHIQIITGNRTDDAAIWVYSHWSGTELPELSRTALAEAEGRWDDPSYGARVVVTKLIGGVEGDTGWGIGVSPEDMGDGGRVVKIDFTTRTVTLRTSRAGDAEPLSFQEYVGAENRHAWRG